jgi:hypothetical protein
MDRVKEAPAKPLVVQHHLSLLAAEGPDLGKGDLLSLDTDIEPKDLAGVQSIFEYS